MEQNWGVFNCPLCNSTHAALTGIDSFPFYFESSDVLFDNALRAGRATTSDKVLATMTKTIATTNVTTPKTLTTTRTTTTTKSTHPGAGQTEYSLFNTEPSVSDDEKCIIHGLERSMFCKEDGCQRNVCSVCLMKNHGNHAVTAREYGFVYCSDPSVVDTIETMYNQMAGMLINAGKPEVEVLPGNGIHEPEVEVQEGTKTPMAEKETSETKQKEKASAVDFEIVYNRASEEKGLNRSFYTQKEF